MFAEGHFSLNNETALSTRLVESRGMPSVSHSRMSSSLSDSFSKDRTSAQINGLEERRELVEAVVALLYDAQK